ncbi:PD40 domain-containing protein [Fibrella sp. HMF5335]|uniref:PD40 domain-containing protein n=1 Tax=Fibrella rubiginis TaxID=2817060 RepID=A0A939GJB0_9BACT|nr:carboxypeptidase-like regulatory domain-containing protein [Fibrella rubiginis]MBO0937488.1 PD40 domain-containing protein [Fibrella rubiginis]
MYKLSLIALVALLVGLWSCTEETLVDPLVYTSVRGQVLISATRKPVKGVLVRISPGSRITETDSTGNFKFDSLTAGKYSITATLAPYRTEVVTVDASTGSVSQIAILLVTDNSQNRPPTIPTVVKPVSTTSGLPTTLTLKWAATDPGRDTLRYDVQLFREGSTAATQSFTNILADSVVVRNLDYNVTYVWQVTARDGVNTVNSPLFSFRTAAFPDLPYVFARRVNGQLQIFAAANGTDAPLQLTTAGNNWRPIGSPDRKLIAYISNVDTELNLYIMNPDGSNQRRVTSVPLSGLSALDLSFTWSPDGTQLVYPAGDKLYAVRTDGTGLRLVASAPGRQFAGCTWSGQTNRIVARTTSGYYNNELALIPVNGTDPQTLLKRENNRVGNPVFSLDGKQLVFTIDQGDLRNEQGRQADARIYRLDLSNNALTEVTATSTGGNNNVTTKPAGTNDLDPRYDPTGSKLIFTNTDNTGTGVRSIVVLDLDGRNRTTLITNGEMPYWR